MLLKLKYLFISTFKEFIKFGFVGILNTLITLVIIFFFINYLKIHYIFANAIGYMAGFLNSFILNKKWTFRSKGNTYKEFIIFSIIFLFCYILQLLSLIFFYNHLKIEQNISQLLSMIVYTLVNFLSNKFLTFR